jgi:pimeloyl-ACP methyl ester carboxylesterase
MERIKVAGGELEGRSDGTGEPVLLIHGSIIGDTFHPLRSEPDLASRYRLITYNRRGFAGSVHHTGAFSIKQQAEDAAAVLRHFGVERAHVAGHSYGGAIALQLQQDAPGSVHSLLMLEPALFNVPSGGTFVDGAAPVIAAYQAGDSAGAVSAFVRLVFSEPNWRERIEPHLPAGWWDQSVRDASTMFDVEFPAIGEWAFTDVEATRVDVPVFAMLGGDSSVFFVEGLEMMKQWWPALESTVLPGASHNLQFANPRGAASAIASFLAKHPIRQPQLAAR